jgi:hypothetical protein
MNADLIVTLVTAAITFVASITTSAFIAGSRWGTISQEMRSMNDRLSRIEGMFTLTVKDREK